MIDLHIDAVLASVELDALAAHRKGRDVRELMALLDKVAWKEGEEQEEALSLITTRSCSLAICDMLLASRPVQTCKL